MEWLTKSNIGLPLRCEFQVCGILILQRYRSQTPDIYVNSHLSQWNCTDYLIFNALYISSDMTPRSMSVSCEIISSHWFHSNSESALASLSSLTHSTTDILKLKTWMNHLFSERNNNHSKTPQVSIFTLNLTKPNKFIKLPNFLLLIKLVVFLLEA